MKPERPNVKYESDNNKSQMTLLLFIFAILLFGIYTIFQVTKKEAQSHYDKGVKHGKESMYGVIQELIDGCDNYDTIRLVKSNVEFVKCRVR